MCSWVFNLWVCICGCTHLCLCTCVFSVHVSECMSVCACVCSCVCTCMLVCTCVWVCVCVCAWVCVNQKFSLGVVLYYPPYLLFLKRSISVAWNSQSRGEAGWPASYSNPIGCTSLHRPQITTMCSHTSGFTWVLGSELRSLCLYRHIFSHILMFRLVSPRDRCHQTQAQWMVKWVNGQKRTLCLLSVCI